MSYESWRISFQSSEQAARAAYEQYRDVYAELERVLTVPDGWRLWTADNSIQDRPINLMLVRDEAGKAAWHKLSDEAQELVELYARGQGKTLPRAMADASANASGYHTTAEVRALAGQENNDG